jgi:hypothetical protein
MKLQFTFSLLCWLCISSPSRAYSSAPFFTALNSNHNALQKTPRHTRHRQPSQPRSSTLSSTFSTVTDQSSSLGDLIPQIPAGGAATPSPHLHHPSSNVSPVTTIAISSPPQREGLTTAPLNQSSLSSQRVSLSSFSPLERLSLTANGNLQRIFSSLYDEKVEVIVDYCYEDSSVVSSSGSTIYNRQVHLTLPSRLSPHPSPKAPFQFVRAKSTITLTEPDLIARVNSGTVGIGQLFREVGKLPTFELIECGRRRDDKLIVLPTTSSHKALDHPTSSSSSSTSSDHDDVSNSPFDAPNNGIFRMYNLKTPGISCLIREDFHPQSFDIEGQIFSSTGRGVERMVEDNDHSI